LKKRIKNEIFYRNAAQPQKRKCASLPHRWRIPRMVSYFSFSQVLQSKNSRGEVHSTAGVFGKVR
jgi:hypothetical protein